MRVVCISDTHNCNGQISVPDGDVLVHSGDATITGTVAEIKNFNTWFSALPHRHKVFIAGNHDWLFERENAAARELLSDNITYLQDSAVEIEGLKFYGSPWQPRFFDWAFNLDRGPELARRAVPVTAADTAETLEARVKALEPGFFVETLQRLAAGELRLSG